MPDTPERLPLEPLWRQAELQWGATADDHRPHTNGDHTAGRPFSALVLADMIGVHVRAIRRWRAEGNTVPLAAAERAARALGLGIHDLWPDQQPEGDTAWMARAACKDPGVDTDLFFPDVTYKRGARQPSRADVERVNEAAAPARLVCSRCPVRGDCLDYALELGPNLDGVWGGTVPHERHLLRREARAS